MLLARLCTDPKAQYMRTNFETHDKTCCIAAFAMPWCCGAGGGVLSIMIPAMAAENYKVMTRFKALHGKAMPEVQLTATAV